MKMKKWSGGTLILVLSFILVVRYSYFSGQPPNQGKQSAYDFFRNHPTNDSQAQEIDSIERSSRINETKVEKPKEKPWLIDVEGIAELYSSVNMSKEDMKSFATWHQLRIVLLRSDGLPETGKGVKEASVAWRELQQFVIKDVKSTKTAENGEGVNSTSEIRCPFSVSTFDELVNSSGRLLELLCGLIEGSSVTLIGIPNGKNRSFQIELEGAGSQNEKRRPIILHYDVYLPEENSTKTSVIVQNAWTNEVGWGKEERCPGRRSTNYIQVDGLSSCYEQLIRSAMEEKQNSSHPISDRTINNSMAHAHVRANFPFSEGSPFTATLWAGMEGFHMTVNGRHETSFKYREHKNAEVNLDLWKEAQAYGDIQLMPFVDYYSLISLKTIAVCILGTKILPAKYIMKTDDDAFVRIDEVLSNLKEKAANGLLYGLISFQSSPHRDQDSKWFVSEEEWPKDSFPPWAHGPGYIVSRDIAKYIIHGHQERDLKLFKLEDVAMGIWIDQYKINGHEVKYISDDRFYNTGCDTDCILAHYQNPRKVLCLWEKLRKEHQAAFCE